jgi:preprotein translocase subunit SecB
MQANTATNLTADQTTQEQTTTSASNFIIQHVYVKDISFESPNPPYTFDNAWQPELEVNLATQSKVIKDTQHEVVLTITTKVSVNNKLAFLVEVKQAGSFLITGLTPEQLHHALGSFCPNILFPFAREVIADLVTRGGYPQLLLAPVNFDALYQQHLTEQNNGSTAQHDASAN